MRRELERKLLPCLDEHGMTWQHGLLRQRPGRQGGGRARGPRAGLARFSRGPRAGLFQRTGNNRWWCSLTAELPPRAPPRSPWRNPRRRRLCRCRYVIDFPILLSSRLIINCRLQCYHVCVHVSLNLIWWDVQTDGAPHDWNKQTNKKERKRRRVAIQTKNQQKTAQRNNPQPTARQ